MRNDLLNPETHDLLVRYLLGDLSTSERERLEEEYFVHEDTWEALAAIENDLIDAYVKGKLPERERQQFENYYLRSPRRQRRLEFARSLMDAGLRKELATPVDSPVSLIPQPDEPRRPARFSLNAVVRWQLLASAAILVIVSFLFWQNYRLRIQVRQLQSEQRQASSSVLGIPGQQAGTASPADNRSMPVIPLALSPGILRDSGSSNALAAIRRGASPSVVLMILNLERDPYSQYDVILQTAEGQIIERTNGIRSKPASNGGRSITLAVPSDLLAKGDYIVRIVASTRNHVAVVDSYAFSIIQ